MMNNLVDLVLAFLLLSGFGLLGSSRLVSCIRISAAQGIALGFLILAGNFGALSLRVMLIVAAVVALKGFVFPRLLVRALRESETSREVQPFVGYVGSLVIGVVILIVSFWLGLKAALPVASSLMVTVAFFLFLTGLFLIIARKTAVNQVVGYLVMENGIYTFGFAAAGEIPALVELGVLLDVFVAVFVMGIAIYRINSTFDHIDSDQLRSLRG